MEGEKNCGEEETVRVTCPKCGKTISISKMCDEDIICPEKDCRTRFHAWVHKGTVMSHLVGDGEEALTGEGDFFTDATKNIRALLTI